MRPTWSSTLWLELLGGLLIVLGALLALAAWYLAANPPDPSLNQTLLKVGLNLVEVGQGIAARVSALGAGLAVMGAVLFFGAAYLMRAFRVLLGLLVLVSIGVWLWISQL